MAKTYTYEWAIGSWGNRAGLNFVPIDKKIGGKDFDTVELRFGGKWIPCADKLPYKMENTETGVSYITYSSAESVAIIRITEG